MFKSCDPQRKSFVMLCRLMDNSYNGNIFKQQKGISFLQKQELVMILSPGVFRLNEYVKSIVHSSRSTIHSIVNTSTGSVNSTELTGVNRTYIQAVRVNRVIYQ